MISFLTVSETAFININKNVCIIIFQIFIIEKKYEHWWATLLNFRIHISIHFCMPHIED